jgi:uncharacterized UBP type Zn finger protein
VSPLRSIRTLKTAGKISNIAGCKTTEREDAAMNEPPCSHLDAIHRVRPSSDGCDACRSLGDTWVHLRMCETCGNVACCDSSKNKHATKHYHASHHPIITSREPGEHWLYCYVDDVAWE